MLDDRLWVLTGYWTKKPHFLTDCLPEAVLNSVSHGPLHKATHNLTAGFSQSKQVREQERLRTQDRNQSFVSPNLGKVIPLLVPHFYSLEVSHWRRPQGQIRTTSLCLVLTIKTSWKWWHSQSHSYPSFTLPLSTIPIQILGPTAHWWLGVTSVSQGWCPKVNRWKLRTHNTKLSLAECISESIWYIHMTHSLSHWK